MRSEQAAKQNDHQSLTAPLGAIFKILQNEGAREVFAVRKCGSCGLGAKPPPPEANVDLGAKSSFAAIFWFFIK